MSSFLDDARIQGRKVVRQIAKGVHKYSGGYITPNIVTSVSTIAHVPAMIFVIQGEFILAGLIFLFFGAFDVLDGELARLTKKASSFGMMYDASTDRLKIGLIMAGVAQYLALNGNAEWVFVPVLAFGVSATLSYVKAKAEVGLAIKHPNMTHHEINRYFKEGLLPYDLLYVFVAVGLFLEKPLEMSWFVLVLGFVSLAWLMLKVRKHV